MREIKFRLINDGKIVGYETHELDTPCGTMNIYHNDMNIEAVEDAYVIHDSKDQFIGPKDKNGVEIYENDNIKGFLEIGDDSYDFEGRVVFGNGQFYVEGADFPLDSNDYFEVIGNIHEEATYD